MGKIIQLPDYLIAKIAAGEVIERPAYALKELIENSIDARADYIKIDLEQAGLKKIMVTDNGEGMSKKDLLACFKIHTTSKVNIEDELVGIKTLGFRGEALASIAAVSNLTILSKTKNELSGTKVILKKGELVKTIPIGMPSGTTVLVENLFSQIPARKKFLKSNLTEIKLCLDTVINISVAFPKIRFIFTHNKKRIFDFPKQADSLERIKHILGSSIFNNLLSFTQEESYLKASGFIAKPQTATKSSNKQFIFINHRKVQDKMLSLAVKEAFGTLLDLEHTPIFVLFLELPYELIDINVHPRKEQIAFINSQLVFEFIQKIVLKTLMENNIVFKSPLKDLKITESFAGNLLKQSTDIFKVINSLEIIDFSDVQQINNTYLVTPTKTGLLLVDQHAAHERILYEQFLKEFIDQKNQKKKFFLSESITTELSLTDSQFLKENKKNFEDLGFELEEFGNSTFKITAVPLLFKDRDIKKLIVEILEQLNFNQKIKDLDSQSFKLLKYLACRTATKAGDKLTKKQSQELIKKLENTPNSITCPHGRPTKFEISLDFINKNFKRN